MTRLGETDFARRGLGIVVGALALVVLPSAAGAASGQLRRDDDSVHGGAGARPTSSRSAASGTDVVLLRSRRRRRWSTLTGRAAARSPARRPPARCRLRHHPCRRSAAKDDSLSSTGNLAPLTAFTFDAGGGDDTIRGRQRRRHPPRRRRETTSSTATRATTRRFGGTGTDTFQWDPGDGSDILEGQENLDTLRFNGSNINEKIELSANGPRLRLTRDVAAIVMDISGVEAVDVPSFGGADTTTVDDLTGTDVTELHRRLHDGRRRGRPARRQRDAAGRPASASRRSPAAPGERPRHACHRVTGEPTTEGWWSNGLAGDDQFAATPDVAAPIGVHFDGGADTDTAVARGTAGADVFAVAANGTSPSSPAPAASAGSTWSPRSSASR